MQWFLDISTRGKLLISFGLMIALLGFVTATAYQGFAALQETQRVLLEREFANVLDIKDARSNQNGARANVATMMLVEAVADRQALLDDTRRRARLVEDSLQRLLQRNLSSNTAWQTKLKEFDTLSNASAKARDNDIIPMILSGRSDEAKGLFVGTQYERNVKLAAIAAELIMEVEAAANAAVVQSEQNARQSQRVFAVIGVLALLLGFVLAFLLSRVLADPLKALSVAAERAAAGDLTTLLPRTGRKDEVGVLIRTFDQMLTNLREVMREVSEGINVLASAAIEISAATSQVAAGSAETAAAVSQTATTVEEVKQTAQVSAQKAKLVSDTAQKNLQISQGGRKSTNESIEAMHRIQEQMESIAESIVRLSEQGQAIGEIIASVSDLAEQSNLLAVNAAIEAAKAGDQGKGFAVVAQEIKSMAEQSKQATAQVRKILGDIQRATSSAVMATEQGSKAVDAGVERSVAAGDSIRQLADGITEAAQAATQISASAQQQMIGMDQVSFAMQNVNQASMQNVASTRQSETAALNLQALGLKLKQLIERYRK